MPGQSCVRTDTCCQGLCLEQTAPILKGWGWSQHGCWVMEALGAGRHPSTLLPLGQVGRSPKCFRERCSAAKRDLRVLCC